MANLAKVILVGNLTRNPELRYTTGGTAVTTLSVAVNRRFKRGEEWAEEVSFFDVAVFGRRAETCAEYLSKGRPVLVEGELVQRRWEAKDGGKRSKVEVQARDVQFLGSRPDGDGGGGAKPASGPAGGPPPIDDDDIPF
jgi:single-strand DNA-binding protein